MAQSAVLSKQKLSPGSQSICHQSQPAKTSCKRLDYPSVLPSSGQRRQAASSRCCPQIQAADRDTRFSKNLGRAQGSRKVVCGQPFKALRCGSSQQLGGRRESCHSTRVSGQGSTVVAESVEGKDGVKGSPEPYKDGPMDVLFFKAFRRAMVREAGSDSPASGYDGLIEVARKLVARHKSREETEDAAVRILQSLFPPFLLPAFRRIITPLGDGRPAAVLTAWVTQWSCQWLMGRCQVNDVQLSDGTTQRSGVLVEKCKYLEESGCAGICVHTCKMPTQAFMKHDMGIPLTMEPNYEDYSCQFKFGVEPPSRDVDEALKVGCLSICPTAKATSVLAKQCPQVAVS